MNSTSLTVAQKCELLMPKAGWFQSEPGFFGGSHWYKETQRLKWKMRRSKPFPFFTDLNAVAKVEANLTDQQWHQYRRVLWAMTARIVDTSDADHDPRIFGVLVKGGKRGWLSCFSGRAVVCATAAERAEALGISLLLWEPIDTIYLDNGGYMM